MWAYLPTPESPIRKTVSRDWTSPAPSAKLDKELEAASHKGAALAQNESIVTFALESSLSGS